MKIRSVVADRQTDKQTDKQTPGKKITSFVKIKKKNETIDHENL